MATLRKYLIAGVLVWLPLMATVAIFKLVVDLLDKTLLLLPARFQPQALFGFSVPGFGVLLAAVVLIITGMLAANLLGRKLVSLGEGLLGRIPFVRNVYNAIKQIAATVLTADSKAFRKVVLVQYPRAGLWSIGFLSNEKVLADCAGLEPEMVSVFVPTTPNPTSGFIILLPRDDVTELSMTVEEGFKFVISMGVVVPAEALKAGAPAPR
jgi:uncharacterized membrane protein